MSRFPLSRPLVLKLALAGVILAGLAYFILRGLPLKEWAEVVLAWVRGVGPLPFFVAMVVLPALGFPMLAFSMSAASVFVPTYGWGWVLGGIGLAIASNLSLSYVLARWALRPWVSRLLQRLGYSIPDVAEEDEVSLILLVRFMPGPPLFVQSYLLGLACVSFGWYLAISWFASMTYSVTFAFFGEALVQGRGKLVLLALSLLIALTVAVRWIRRRLQRERVSASSARG